MCTLRKIWENSNITYPVRLSAQFDEPMADHTSFRVGGPADIFVEPASVDQLIGCITKAKALNIPVFILGGGSNVLVSDRGIRGLVVSFANFNHIHTIDSSVLEGSPSVLVRAECGVSIKSLTQWCQKHGIAGLQRFAGLPGTVGGAVFMNARCYDISISDVFFASISLYYDGERCTLEKESFNASEWSYKKSPFQQRTGNDSLELVAGGKIILSADFCLSLGDPEELEREMNRWISDREAKGHFKFPSAGSMFKNDRKFGKPSGLIIDEVGLRGFRIGDAQVAPWHGNIVINAGSARAEDLRFLIEEVQRRVFAETGYMLEKEVVLAGDW